VSGRYKRSEGEEAQFTGDTAARGRQHSLEISDRGANHRHRFVGRCACGWATTPIRSRKTVTEQYRNHASAGDRRRARRSGGPRPLTPYDQLPEALR
jgi:hypothetical protein